MENKYKLILLCAPSGTGKTTVARMLAATDIRFRHVQVLTTRRVRPSEIGRMEKVPIELEKLQTMNDNGELVSFNQKDGVYYGIKREAIAGILNAGVYPVLEWDINNLNYWDDKFPAYKVVLEPSSIEHMNKSQKDGRDPQGLREEGALKELDLIKSGTLKEDLKISNFDNALMDSVQLIRSSLFKTYH